jgi:hypothetical protein
VGNLRPEIMTPIAIMITAMMPKIQASAWNGRLIVRRSFFSVRVLYFGEAIAQFMAAAALGLRKSVLAADAPL